MFLRAGPPKENLSEHASQPRTSRTSRVRVRFSENTCQDGRKTSFSSQIIIGDGSKRTQCSPATTQYIRPPEYSNRFARMNLDKDVIIRTWNGFVDFFNSNACHMLKEVWEKAVIPRKGFEETPQVRNTLVENSSPRSIQPSSDFDLECFRELESKPVIADTTTEELLLPKLSITPFSGKENIQLKSVGGENEMMHNSHIQKNPMANQDGHARKKRMEPPGTYDFNFKNRCRTYMAKRQCPDHFCQYLHSLPKDANVLCRDFETGFCSKTAAECWFKHTEKKNIVAKRCFEYLTNRWCHKGDYCKYLHRLPKDDNIPCKFFLVEKCKYGKNECIYLHRKEEQGKEKTAVVAEKDENTCDKKSESRCKADLPKGDDIICKVPQAGDCLESAESCHSKHSETSHTSEEISERALDDSASGSFLGEVRPVKNSQDDRVSCEATATLPTSVNTRGGRAEGKHVSEVPKSDAVSNLAVKMTVPVSPDQSEIPALAKDLPPKQQSSVDSIGKPLPEVGKNNIVKDCGQSQILDSQEETNKLKSVVPDINPSLTKSHEESQNVVNSHDSECSHSLSPIQTGGKLCDAPPRVERLDEQPKAAPVECRDVNSQSRKRPIESATSPSAVASQHLNSEPSEGEMSKPEPSVSNADAPPLKHHEELQNDNVKLNDKYIRPLWDSGNKFENASRVEPMTGKPEGVVSESAEQIGIHTSAEDSLPGKQLIEHEQKCTEAPVKPLVVKDGEFRCVDTAEETSQPKSIDRVTDTPTIPLKEQPTGASSQDDSSSHSVKPLQSNKNPAGVSHGNETSGSSPISHLPCKSKSGGPDIKEKCKSKSDHSPGLSGSTEVSLKHKDIQHHRKKQTEALKNMTDTEHVNGKQHMKHKQKSAQFPVQPLHCVGNEAETNHPESFYPVTDTPILKSPKEVQIDRKCHYNQSSESVKPLQANKDWAGVGLGTSGSSPIKCLTDNEKAKRKSKKLKNKGTSDAGICPTTSAVMLDKSKELYVREYINAHITPFKKSQRQTMFSSSSGSNSTHEFSESDDIQYKRMKPTAAQVSRIDIEQKRVDDEVQRMPHRRNRGAPASRKRKHLPSEEDSLSSTTRECKLAAKSLKPTYYLEDDENGFPISTATTREDLFHVIGRIVDFPGTPREEDFDELYSEFARVYEELTQWKLLKSEKSDKFIVLEANVRILIAFIYNDEEGALKMRDSLVEHWSREPDLKAFKKKMERFANNC